MSKATKIAIVLGIICVGIAIGEIAYSSIKDSTTETKNSTKTPMSFS